MAIMPFRRESTLQARGSRGGRVSLFDQIQRDFDRLHDEMNRLMSGLPMAAGEGEGAMAQWSPQVDVYEDDKGIRVKADLPGVEPKDVDVRVEGNILTIKGERSEEKEEREENRQRTERFYGSFQRSFSLPEYADTDNINANFKNGVLQVSVGCKPEAQQKRKQIEVKAE